MNNDERINYMSNIEKSYQKMISHSKGVTKSTIIMYKALCEYKRYHSTYAQKDLQS